jgi:NADH:ubiquinone oxidoreductase subunit 5 (subunit L)/multisubunit Na+/H+ antiporter MnhA subunit
VFLAVAMFGSALTLASFVKVLHSTFLGSREGAEKKYKEVSWTMSVPMIVLALFCVAFGIFASYPIDNFILTAFGTPGEMIGAGVDGTMVARSEIMNPTGWTPDIATLLIMIGLFVGIVFFYLGRMKKVRVTPVFIGGNRMNESTMRFTGTDFYETIKKLKFIGPLYRDSGKGWYDPYNIVAQTGSFFIKGLKAIHNGVLSTYLSWCLIGLAVLLIYLLKGMLGG